MKRFLVVYITLGYPSVEKFIDFISRVGGLGADYIEIGIPPNFAKYDGPAIRRSYEYVKRAGVDVDKLLGLASKVSSAPLIALTYLEDHIDSIDLLAHRLTKSGIEYVLLPDLLIDYVDRYREIVERLRTFGIRTTIFVSPSTPDKLIAEASEYSTPFLYLGLRPATGIPLPVDPAVLINRVRKVSRSRLVVGFGLSLSDISKVVEAGADGIAVGTSVVEAIESGGIEKALDLVRKLRGALDGL